MLSWYWLILLCARAILLVVLTYALYKTMPLYRRMFHQQPISGLILTLLIAALIGVPARNLGLADQFRGEVSWTQIVMSSIAVADWLLLFLWGYPWLSLLMALLFGLVGWEFGLGDLFWHLDGRTQFLAGLSLAGLCLFLFSVSFYWDKNKVYIHRLTRWALFEHGRSSLRWPAERSSEEASSTSETSDPDPAGSLRRYLNAMFLVPVFLLVTRVVWVQSAANAAANSWRDWRLVAGLVTLLALANLVLWIHELVRNQSWFINFTSQLTIPSRLRLLADEFHVPDDQSHDPSLADAALGRWALVFVILLPLVFIGLFPRTNQVGVHNPSGVTICVLLALISVFGLAIKRMKLTEAVLAVTVLLWFGITNGNPNKLSDIAFEIMRLLYLLLLFYFLYKALPLYKRWFNRQPVYGIILAFLMAVLFGVVGQNFGISDLFWHEIPATQFLAGVSLAGLWLLMFSLTCLHEDDMTVRNSLARWMLLKHGPSAGFWPPELEPHGGPEPSALASSRLFLNAMFLPLILLSLSRFMQALFTSDPSKKDGLRDGMLVAGLLVVLALVNLGFWGAERIANRCWFIGLSPPLTIPPALRKGAIVFHLILPVVLIGLLARANLNQITAAMAICSLLAVIAIVSFATYRNELAKLGLAIVVIVWMALTNSDPYKMRFPGLDRYYHADKFVKPTSRIGSVDDGGPTEDQQDEVVQKLARKRREIDELTAVTTTSPRDNEAFNALGRAYFEAAVLQEKRQARPANLTPGDARPGVATGDSGFFRKAIAALMQSIAVLSPRTATSKEAKSQEGFPTKAPDSPPTDAQTSNELCQKAIEAFTKSIRILPNEAIPYAGRAGALEMGIRKLLTRVAMPSIVGESAAAGSVGPFLRTGNQEDRLPAEIASDTIARLEKSIRDDYLMAKELDPDDRSVCLACFNYFDKIKDYNNIVSISMKSIDKDDDFANYFEKHLRAGFAKGDINGVIAELEKEVPPELNRSDWNYWLGWFLVMRATLDKRSDREADLSKALENFSKWSPSANSGHRQDIALSKYYYRAWARLSLGDPKGAIEDVEEAGKVGKSKQLEPFFHFVRGKAFVMQGKTKEAEVEFEAFYNGPRADGPAPEPVKSSRSLFALSSALARRDDLGGALDYLDKAIGADERNFRALAVRGVLLSRTGDLNGAMRDLQHAIDLGNWGEDSKPRSYARRLLGRVLIMKGTGKKDVSIGLYGGTFEKASETPYIWRSQDLIEAGKVDEAIEDLVYAIKLARHYKQTALAWVMLGDLLTVKSPLDDALNAYAMGRLLEPASPTPHVRRGLIRAYDGDLNGGLEDVRIAHEAAPWDSDVLSHYGAVHALKGDFVEANKLLDKAVQGNNEDPKIHLWRAIAWIFQRQYEELDYEADDKAENLHAQALKDFRELLRFDSSSPLPMSNLGVTLAWKGDLKRAKWALEQAIEENPRDSRALRYLGAVLARMGDYDGALCKLQLVTGSCGAAFKSRVPCGSGTGVSQLGYIGGCSDKATGLDPRDAHAKALIGAVLALKGKQNEALCMVKEAKKLNSHDPRVRSLRGGVLALAGQKDEAICELGEAIGLDCRDSWTYALRGALQRSSGNAMEAVKDYEQAQWYAIMGERVEYLDEPLDVISDDIAVNHASESSRTRGASERPPRQAEKTKEPEPQRIVGNILKKMLIAKEREVFHPDYFSKRLRRIEDLSVLPYPDPRLKPPDVSLPEKDLEPGGLDDQKVLETWSDRVRKLQRSTQGSQSENASDRRDDKTKPKLVVVATSGGGITAAYWTALCLIELERQFTHFPDHVRVITGASGGMVGAAAYVSQLTNPDSERSGKKGASRDKDDARKTPAQRREDLLASLRKDSLTPLIREMVFFDLPAIFAPDVQKRDRGLELERVWDDSTDSTKQTEDGLDQPGGPNTGFRKEGLGVEFLSLAKGEKDGWRPSLIISPLIIEGSQQLLISNLNLDGLGGGMEFFKQFRRAGLKLSTALRMNATFPFVTPVASLPTTPPRRVVDAGYKENYGVDLATEWLQKHRQWLSRHTSGVILIQIRAYPLDAVVQTEEETDEDDASPSTADDGTAMGSFRAKMSRAMEFLTSPLEGVMSVNKGTMITINNQKIDRLGARFNDPNQPVIFRTFVLTSTAAAPLSWYLTDRDTKLLEKALRSKRNQTQIGQIARLLKEGMTEPSRDQDR